MYLQNTCLSCQKQYRRYRENRTGRRGEKFCSSICYWKNKKMPYIKKTCLLCQKEFSMIRSDNYKKRIFCSQQCSGKVNHSKIKPITELQRIRLSENARLRGTGKWMKGRPGNKGSIKKGQFSGEKHPMWKGGITPINQVIRHSDKYKLWREAVFKRDGYRCFDCGERGGRLEADHLYPFAFYPRLRFEINNGQTVCKNCHKERTRRMLKVHWKNQYKNYEYVK